MRTNFSSAQLDEPHLAAVEENLRNCVHCGICTATCPTYVLLGDERDGPRGRIVMMQQMLEEDATPSPETVLHVDRCLSCLACRTACPSSVDYARLVDTARAHIETRYRRPFADRILRWLLATVMPRPALVRFGLLFAPLGRWLPGSLGAMASVRRVKQIFPVRKLKGFLIPTSKRIALMPGCVQRILAPDIEWSVHAVLARRGYTLARLKGAGCCGSLVHHLGKEGQAKAWARRAIEAFEREGPFDGVLITATGCSAYLKDLAHLFADDPIWLPRAETFAAKTRDFLDLATPLSAIGVPSGIRVAWQAPCTLQNGLKLADAGKILLKSAGFEVLEIAESHLCCGSAGTYSILQPEIAGQLRSRKLSNVSALKPDVIATANIGCLHHLSGPDAPPIVHIAELVDWAEDGSAPVVLSKAKIAR